MSAHMGEARLVIRYLYNHPEKLSRVPPEMMPEKFNQDMVRALVKAYEVRPTLELLSILEPAIKTELIFGSIEGLVYWDAVFGAEPCSATEFEAMVRKLETHEWR